MVARSGMIEGMAELFGVPLSSVDTLDRALAKSGLRTRTPGGRAPENMLAIDIVNLAFALQNRWSIRDTPIRVGEITNLPLARAVHETCVEGPDGEPVWVPLNTITAEHFAKGHLKAKAAYPSKELPLESAFGQSLSNFVERILDIEAFDKIYAEIRREPLRASIGFRSHRIGERFYVVFGPDVEQDDVNQPYSMFGFGEPVLKKLALILRS